MLQCVNAEREQTDMMGYKYCDIFTYFPTYLPTYIFTYLHIYVFTYLPRTPTYLHVYLFLFFKVGVFSSCDATDTWSWTAQGSLQYKKKMCLKPETGGAHPRNHVDFVLDSVCDERQNYLEFMRSKYLSVLYVTGLSHVNCRKEK